MELVNRRIPQGNAETDCAHREGAFPLTQIYPPPRWKFFRPDREDRPFELPDFRSSFFNASDVLWYSSRAGVRTSLSNRAATSATTASPDSFRSFPGANATHDPFDWLCFEVIN